MRRSPVAAFAGIFVVTLLVADRGRRGAPGPAALREGAARLRQHRGRDRGRLLRAHRPAPAAPRRAASPTTAAASRRCCSARCSPPLAGLLYLLPLGARRPDRRPARARRGRGRRSSPPARPGSSTWRRPSRRGRVIGLYGLAVWSGLSVGPPIGELLQHASGYDARLGLRRRAAAARGRWSRLRIPDPLPAVAAARGASATR